VEKARAAGGRARIIVNDRLDVVLAAGANGVHLGGSSLPVAEVRAWLRQEGARLKVAEDFLVGRSCHSIAEAQQAERDGANYIIFGPVYATPSKAQYGAPQGLERLTEVCRAVQIPVLAIGGIAAENASACLRAGAAGIAAIRLFQQAAHVATVVQRIRESS
jgi:thiamine-phosphate pyrophosphorylase